MSAQLPTRSSLAHGEPEQSGPLEFKKQPVSAAPGSDSEAVSSSDGHELARPLSLLTSLLSSPKSGEQGKRSDYLSGVSASSSPPSTAFGSPRMKEEPVSILRRGSISDGEAFHLPSATKVIAAPTTPEEVRVLSSPPRPALKFAVATRQSPKKPRSVADFLDTSEPLDPGYEEDSEEGMTDSEEDEPAFLLNTRNLALDKALSLLENRTKSPPPPRIYRPSQGSDKAVEERGRAHVRVDPSAMQNHKSCSRHCSPPPAEPEPLRPALPGPREGRAGSPAPSQDILSGLDDDEDEDEEGSEGTDDDASDDSPASRDDQDAPGQSAVVFDSSDEEPTRGLRQMLRRASEHIPAFRRRSFGWTAGDNGTGRTSVEPMSAGGGNVLRARSLSTGPIRIGTSSAAHELRSQPLPCPGRPSLRTSVDS